jgi:mono/diheme cytochrome c family protein
MKSDPARFRLNMEGRDRNALVESEQGEAQMQALVDSLTAAFGTPDEPFAFPGTGLDIEKLRLSAGPIRSVASGQRGGLFRRHCVHCHGISGDGAGPTAAFLHPYPRDYRLGQFKLTSTDAGFGPTRADLTRVLTDGIPGTAMPSFALLPPDEIAALVEYVMYLTMRGQTETTLYGYIFDDEEDLPLDGELIAESVELSAALWQENEDAILTPEPPLAVDTPELMATSIAEGRRLFLDANKGACVKCHGPTGLGDGGQVIYDNWNKDKTDENEHWYTLPRQQLSPRDLHLGVYRFGRRPVDLYRRIHAGIKGTPMPAASTTLTPEEIWHVINFVRSLPFEADAAPDELADEPTVAVTVR